MNDINLNQSKKKTTRIFLLLRNFLIILIISIGFTSNFFALSSMQTDHDSSSNHGSLIYKINEPLKVCSAQYTDHNPIMINGNDDFSTQATAEGWSGDGTLSTPYIIEELAISASSDANVVHIRNTDVYFRLQYCSIEGGYDGITLFNTKNGYIANNRIYGNQAGIVLWDSSNNNVIINNTIYHNHNLEGISIHDSDNNFLISNHVYDNEVGIIVWESSKNNVVIDNNVYSNNLEGIGLHAAENSTLTGNHVYDNQFGIIVWEFSNSNQIANNLASFNSHGIILKSNSNNNNISNNSIYYNDRLGLEIEQGISNYLVEGNNFIANNLGDDTPHQVSDDGSDSVFRYNYWDNWTTPDVNDDGIVDNPYTIFGTSNNQDSYPLTSFSQQTTFHALFLPTIIYPTSGERLKDTITIQWESSNDSLDHQITYSVYYSSDNGKNWILLVNGLTTSKYDWNTSTLVDGSIYLIKVVVVCSEDLIMVNISDGTLSIKNNVTFLDLLSPLLFPLIIVSIFTSSFLVWRFRKRRQPSTDPYYIEIPSGFEESVDQPGLQKSQPTDVRSKAILICSVVPVIGFLVLFFGTLAYILGSIIFGYEPLLVFEISFIIIPVFGGLVFSLGFGGFGLYLLYSSIKNLIKAFTSTRWPSVEGTIESSYIQKHVDGEGGTSYSSQVSYSYTINGKRYQSSEVKFGIPTQLWKGRAQKTVDKYPPTRIVKVFFNPNSPDEAVLEPGVKFGSLLSSLVMLIIMIFGFVIGATILLQALSIR
ncbi:MAG: NosD domain-containing protein [Candidatus Hodarchaeales archaeon]